MFTNTFVQDELNRALREARQEEARVAREVKQAKLAASRQAVNLSERHNKVLGKFGSLNPAS